MTYVPSSAGPVYDQRCTSDERRLLDAVVDAACAETVAEQNAVRATTTALDAPNRSPAITTAGDAARAIHAARAARRDAVQRLLQHRQDGTS